MKVLILSDTHRNMKDAMRMIELTNPDLLMHLGDHLSDAQELSSVFSLDLLAVPGNCDPFCTEKSIEYFTWAHYKILLCHGHQFDVKYGLQALWEYAKKEGCTHAFFGHTHRRYLATLDGLTLLNPGSLVRPVDGKSFAVMTLTNQELSIKLHCFS